MRRGGVKLGLERARVHNAPIGESAHSCRKLSRRDMRHKDGVAPRPVLGTMELGSYMPYSSKQILGCAWLCAALLSSAACTPRRIPPMTVSDLMEDRVTLDGVLMKCNQSPIKARTDSDCLNARIAIERLAKDVDPAVEEKRQADFEHSREQLRLAQEKIRQEQEAKTKVDAYSLPLVPVDPPKPPSGAPPPPQPQAQNQSDSPPLAGTRP